MAPRKLPRHQNGKKKAPSSEGGSKSRVFPSDVPLSEVRNLAPGIPEDALQAIERILDKAFRAASSLQRAAINQPAPSKSRRALDALSKAASNQCGHLDKPEVKAVLSKVAFSYQQDIYHQGQYEGDPWDAAAAQFHSDCEAIRRFAGHVARACRQWDQSPPTNLLIMSDSGITQIEKVLATSGHSCPHDGIIVAAIYKIGVNILALEPVVREHSPFVNFAYKVFGLTGEPTCLYQTMRKRLENKSYQRFHRKLRGVQTPSGKIAAEK
jgi:hypothetical protein